VIRHRHVPTRMCMGCGERAAQDILVRLRATLENTLRVVEPKSARGRSGYLHREPRCWHAFASRKGRVRSLGCNVDKALRLACVEELERALSAAMMR